MSFQVSFVDWVSLGVRGVAVILSRADGHNGNNSNQHNALEKNSRRKRRSRSIPDLDQSG
jgi:hypothetical protein